MDKNKIDGSEITQRIPQNSLYEAEMKTIPVICPWCNTLFKLSEWQVNKDKKTAVTHGICPECFDKILREAKNPKKIGEEAQDPKGIKNPVSGKEKPTGGFRKFFKLKK